MEKWLKYGNWHNYDKLIGPLRIVWHLRMSKNVHSKFRNFVGAWEWGFFEPFLTDDYARSQHFSAQILTKHVTLEPKVTITIVKPKRIRNGGPENAKPEVRYSVYTKIHIYNKIDILRFYDQFFDRAYQLKIVDFSEFGINAFLSSPGESTSKNNNLRSWVAMVTKRQVVEKWPKMTKIDGKFHTLVQMSYVFNVNIS